MKLDAGQHVWEQRRWSLFGLILLLAGLGGGWWVTDWGFQSIQQLRQLERVPVTQPGAVVDGEAALRSYAMPVDRAIPSSHTATPSIYFRYLHEVEEQDSDGDRRWVTREDVRRAVNFFLADETGSVRVLAGRDLGYIDFSARQRFRTTSGDHRYTEWRIEPGDYVFAFGRAVERADGEVQLRFSLPGHYTPLVSGFDGFTERADMGLWSVLRLWVGLALLGLGAFGLVLAARLHRVLVFITVLGAMLGLALCSLGLRMMHDDLDNAVQRYERQLEASAQRMARSFQQAGDYWPGWEALGELADPPYDTLGAIELANLREVRLNLAVAHGRTAALFQRVPERWLAPLWGLQVPAPPLLPPGDQTEVLQRMAAFEPTRVDGGWVWAAAIAGLLLALAMTWWGIRQVRFKRCIENLPTSRTRGAACGLVELVGRVMPDHDEAPLVSPLRSHQCCWYRYKVEERRSDGKDTKWVTIENRTECQKFLLQDDEGQLLVDPRRAEVITHRREVERRGDWRYTEAVLLTGEEIYALGMAVVDRSDASRLRVVKGEASDPFMLSNYPESMVMLKKARGGIIALTVAFTGLLLALLLAFATAGSFAATDFLLAAMAAPIYLFGVLVALHYNDLLFLRERARRNWSNIQVSLRKRHNLMPVLERLVKKYLQHERDLLEQITTLRGQIDAAATDPAKAGQFLALEQRMETRFLTVVEAYPRLKGATVVQKLSRGLVDLENEIALMRSGYNDAVEHYNARIATFPDALLARAFDFRRLDYLAL